MWNHLKSLKSEKSSCNLVISLRLLFKSTIQCNWHENTHHEIHYFVIDDDIQNVRFLSKYRIFWFQLCLIQNFRIVQNFSRNGDTFYCIHDWIIGNSALKVMMVKTSGPSSKDRVGHTIVWFFSIEKELFCFSFRKSMSNDVFLSWYVPSIHWVYDH